MHELNQCETGDICAVTGLNHVKTGDTITLYNIKHINDVSLKKLPSLQIPQPVFYTTIEPEHEIDRPKFHTAINCLIKDDPSIICEIDESEQIIIKGI